MDGLSVIDPEYELLWDVGNALVDQHERERRQRQYPDYETSSTVFRDDPTGQTYLRYASVRRHGVTMLEESYEVRRRIVVPGSAEWVDSAQRLHKNKTEAAYPYGDPGPYQYELAPSSMSEMFEGF